MLCLWSTGGPGRYDLVVGTGLACRKWEFGEGPSHCVLVRRHFVAKGLLN